MSKNKALLNYLLYTLYVYPMNTFLSFFYPYPTKWGRYNMLFIML
jgi:hypothetical protein